MCGWAGSWRVYELESRESGAVTGRSTVLLESVVESSGGVRCGVLSFVVARRWLSSSSVVLWLVRRLSYPPTTVGRICSWSPVQ